MNDTTPSSQNPEARILVVDDERGPRQSLRMILRPRYAVIEASGASEALRRLEEMPVDLMTLDLNMPGMQGQELLRIVRSQYPSLEIVIVTGHGSLESATDAIRLRVGDYLQKPFDVLQVNAAVSRCLRRQAGQRRMVNFLRELSREVGREEALVPILERMDLDPCEGREVGALMAQVAPRQTAGLASSETLAFLEVLADTVENQSGFLRGHARRTGFYAGLLADRLGLPEDQREHVRIAGFVHDIGKIGVPTDLLLKPAALTEKERRTLQQHPEIGSHMIEPLGLAAEVTTAIRHHHEWWDGRGYGDGLYGDQIPLSARIVGLVDAFDAMASARPYRDALPPERIRAEIEKYAGVQFDPELAQEFLALLDSSEIELPLLAEPGSGAAERAA